MSMERCTRIMTPGRVWKPVATWPMPGCTETDSSLLTAATPSMINYVLDALNVMTSSCQRPPYASNNCECTKEWDSVRCIWKWNICKFVLRWHLSEHSKLCLSLGLTNYARNQSHRAWNLTLIISGISPNRNDPTMASMTSMARTCCLE